MQSSLTPERSRALAMAGVVLAAGVLAFAGPSVSAHQDPVTLVVWTAPDTIGQKWWRAEVPKFEATHPGIRVLVYQESLSDNYAKYTAAIAGHKAPDLILTYSYAIVPSWAHSGFLTPLDPYLKKLHFNPARTFFPFINQLDTIDGHTYGLVQAYDDLLFTWNKAAF